MKRLVLLLASLVLAVGAVGCGGGDDETTAPETVEGTVPTETAAGGEGDAEAGSSVFASAGCGGCHVFEDAGSTGTIGPNLDQSSVDVEAAKTQITNGGGGMPAFGDRLSDEEIANVAAYITERRSG
jgi:mono/diheme cytochrome c family protein